MQHCQRQVGGLVPHLSLLVFEDDVIDAGAVVDGARLPEGDVLAGDVLQLDGDVLEHVTEPRPLILGHAPDEPPRFAVAAPMLVQPREALDEGVDEALAESHGRPVLDVAQVDFEANDREVGVDAGADEGAAV